MDGHEEMKNTENFINQLFKEIYYSRFELEAKYFGLVSGIPKKIEASSIVSKNLLKMNLDDQIKALELLDKLGDLSISLCERYGFNDKDTDEE